MTAILYGVHIGEHGFTQERVIDELNERVIKPGYNFVTIRTKARLGEIIEREIYVSWAEHLAKNHIYFIFLYTMKTGQTLTHSMDAETVAAIKAAAGEYFLGDMIGELGSCFGAKSRGYGTAAELNPYVIPDQEISDMAEAAEKFVKIVNEYVQLDAKIGMPHVASVEPTALAKYIVMGGVDMPMLELMCGNVDEMLPFVRGMAHAFGKNFGTYMAHEWYGGVRHIDALKHKRLALGAKMAYMSGSETFCIESGDECVTAYGQRHEVDSPICEDYREAVNEVKRLAQAMPDRSRPKVSFAFVSGRYDSYAGWGGTSVWGQYGKEEWGYSSAEHSWRMLREIGHKRSWCDIENYGDSDTSAYPAYGSYDVLPIEADLVAFLKYDYLVFLGWNTMTAEDMKKLTEYVRRGGRLLMSLAHLNCSSKRSGEFIYPDERSVQELFGVRFTGRLERTNAGVKFSESLMSGVLYPVTLPNISDPILSGGYTSYAEAELLGAHPLAVLSDGFSKNSKDFPVAVVENRVGLGVATLVCSLDYPGAPALYPLYRVLVRELVSASARSADIKVVAPDKLRYSVHEDGRIYLLNTDYDLPITVRVIGPSGEASYALEPLELKII